jgi:MFS family permease
MTTYLQTLLLFNRNVKLFLVAHAVNAFAYFGIYSLLLNLYLLRLGYGPEFIGLVNALGPLALGLCSMPAGLLSRRWGSRRALIVSYILIVIGFGLLPYAEYIHPAWQQGWLLACYVGGWLGATLFAVNTGPYLMGATSPQERNHAFAMLSALMALAGFAGNLVGGVLPGLFATALSLSLDEAAAYRFSLWIGAALYILPIVAMYLTDEVRAASSQVQSAATEAPPYTIILILALVAFLRTGGLWLVRIFFNVYLDSALQAPVALIGTLSGIGQLMGIVALAAPIVIIRWGKMRSASWSMVVMACSFLPLLFIEHWFAAGLAFMGLMAAFSLGSPAVEIFSQESVGSQWRTTLAGAMTMGMGIGIFIVAFGGGYVIAYVGYRILFAAGAGLLLAGALLFWLYFRRTKVELPKSPVPSV